MKKVQTAENREITEDPAGSGVTPRPPGLVSLPEACGSLQRRSSQACRAVKDGLKLLKRESPNPGSSAREGPRPLRYASGEFGNCRQKVPSFGNFRRQSSKHWKFLDGEVPRFGNSQVKSSKLWKFWKEKFQPLEVCSQEVPNYGKLHAKASRLGREDSNVWKFRVNSYWGLLRRSPRPVPIAASIRRSSPSRHKRESPPGVARPVGQLSIVDCCGSLGSVPPRSDTAGAGYSKIKGKPARKECYGRREKLFPD